jgi:hypothetical protein
LAPDAHGQSQHGDNAERRVFPQRADSVAQISQQLFQHVTNPYLSDFFFDLLQAAQLDACGPPRIRGVHALPALLRGQLVEMGAQFVVEVTLHAWARENIAPQTVEAIQQRHTQSRSARLQRVGDCQRDGIPLLCFGLQLPASRRGQAVKLGAPVAFGFTPR